MINTFDILETIKMIQDECLDIRTTTMGISLLDCADSSIDRACEKVYEKVTRLAQNLVKAAKQKNLLPRVKKSKSSMAFRL